MFSDCQRMRNVDRKKVFLHWHNTMHQWSQSNVWLNRRCQRYSLNVQILFSYQDKYCLLYKENKSYISLHCWGISKWTQIWESELTKERCCNLILKMKHKKHEITLLTEDISDVLENLMYLNCLNLLQRPIFILHFILLNWYWGKISALNNSDTLWKHVFVILIKHIFWNSYHHPSPQFLL